MAALFGCRLESLEGLEVSMSQLCRSRQSMVFTNLKPFTFLIYIKKKTLSYDLFSGISLHLVTHIIIMSEIDNAWFENISYALCLPWSKLITQLMD